MNRLTTIPPAKLVLTQGFTLIELSIVLVIIGLIIGGVLVGQDLVRSAAVRAEIAQIDKYNSAVNTFRGKYGYLPGDIPATLATQYSFYPRGSWEGQGDGNGVIEGNTGGGQALTVAGYKREKPSCSGWISPRTI